MRVVLCRNAGGSVRAWRMCREFTNVPFGFRKRKALRDKDKWLAELFVTWTNQVRKANRKAQVIQ